MTLHALLRPLLKRGVLVAAANWPITLVQAAADSMFKLLIATPVVGGAILVAVVIGGEPVELMRQEWREMATTVVGSLLAHPLVLVAFLLAVAVTGLGGALFVFLVKAGTVAVLVQGERQAGAIEVEPVHLDSLRQAAAFTPEFYIEACRRLFPRYARLGAMLMGVYLTSGGLYLGFIVVLGIIEDAWGLAALSTLLFVAWITVVNLGYLLVQIVIAADDCGVGPACSRAVAFMRHQRRQLSLVFASILAVVVMATGVSLLATIALGLIGFVPFIGLAVLPLQLLAWLFRGLVFQFIGLTSVGAYLRLYRGYVAGRGDAPLPMLVRPEASGAGGHA